MDISLKANKHRSPIVDLDPMRVGATALRRPDVFKPLMPLEHRGLPWPVKRGIWDRFSRPFANHPTFREVESLISAKLDYERLPSFRRAMRQLNSEGFARSRQLRRNRQFSSERLLREHFETVLDLIRSIRERGYDCDKGGPIGLGVGRKGQLIKMKHGHHRLAVAQILGVPSVRFTVVAVHPKWLGDRIRGDRLKSFRSELPAMIREA